MRTLHQASTFFFFNDTATTEIYTLSLHDALPICRRSLPLAHHLRRHRNQELLRRRYLSLRKRSSESQRSEEHTSELQSQSNLVCRLLLEKKKYHRQRCQH